MAVLEEGYFRILGRLSVDIIKSVGFKISALEIEDALREHPAIREVGAEDEAWGEAVATAVVPVGEGSSSSKASGNGPETVSPLTSSPIVWPWWRTFPGTQWGSS